MLQTGARARPRPLRRRLDASLACFSWLGLALGRSKPGAAGLLCVQHGVRAAARDSSTASEVFSQSLINVRASETAGKAHKPLSGQVPKHSISNRSDARGRRRRRGD